LAVKVRDQLAYNYKHELPIAAMILKEQFFMDDVLTGAHTEEELIRIQNELIQLVSNGFSNSSRVADRSLATTEVHGEVFNSTAKVLGIHCDPKEDMLSYNVCLTKNPDNTNRLVLSNVALISDPLRILSAVVIQFKILFQELRLLDLGWDMELSSKTADW